MTGYKYYCSSQNRIIIFLDFTTLTNHYLKDNTSIIYKKVLYFFQDKLKLLQNIASNKKK